MWIPIDLLFVFYFICALANEKGWWYTRIFSLFLFEDDFGKNRSWILIMDVAFVALWSYFLFVDVGKVIQWITI